MNNQSVKTLSQLKKGVRHMIVRARVISKGTVKYGYQDKSLKIEIYDGSLEFSTLVYFSCQDCETYHNLIQVGRVYKFAKGQVISDAQKMSNRNCLKYDMYDPSYITPINPEDETLEDAKSLNFNKFELVKINQIADNHQSYHFDVLGVVMEEPTKDKTIDKEGRELETMKFLIGDNSRHTLQISIRNEYGLNLNLKIFDVILIKGTHINVYLNQKSVDSGSGIIVNPDIDEALELLQAFEKIILEDDDNGDGIQDDAFLDQDKSMIAEDNEDLKANEIRNARISKATKKNNKEFTQIGDNKISVHYYDVRTINYVVQQVEDQLERVIRLSLTCSPTDPLFLKEYCKSIYSEIEGEIYSASIEKKPYYVACSVCQKKIENYPTYEKCIKKCQGGQPIAKMTTNLNIADATGAITALAFNEQCNDIFGFDAEFLRILDEAQKNNLYHKKDPTYRDFIRQTFTHKYRFRILSGVQVYEKKLQVKHNIVGCTKVNILQDISETAQSIEMHLQKRNV